MKKKVLYRDLAALAALLFIILIFFFRLFYPAPHIIATPDFGESDAIDNISTKFIYSESLKLNRIPLWTSMLGGGYPIYATAMLLGAWYAPNLVAFKILPYVTAYNLVLVGSVLLLAWGTYLWFRLLKYAGAISLFAALTLSLSGYCVAQLTHISLIQSISLFPIIQVLVLLLTRKKSFLFVGLLSLAISQQLFIGSPQLVLITLLFAFFYCLFCSRRDPQWYLTIIKFTISCLLAIGLSAIQLVPSVEYQSRLSAAKGFSLEEATYFSFPAVHLITLIDPFALGNPKYGTYPDFRAAGGSIFWENTISIGVAPFLLLGLGMFAIIRRRKVTQRKNHGESQWRFFLPGLIASFLLMTGKYSPLYLTYSFWPFTLFRAPSRFVWLFVVSLTFLCTEALSTIANNYINSRNRVTFILTAILTQLVILFATWYSYHAIVPADTWLSPPSLIGYVSKDENTLSIGAEQLHNKTYLTKGWQSMESYNIERDTFTPDQSPLWGVAQFYDYVGRDLARNDIVNSLLAQAIPENETDATVSATAQKLLSLYAIKTITSSKNLTAPSLIRRAHLPFNNSSIEVYDNPDALPLMYVATNILSADTVDAATSTLASDQFVLGKTVLRENVKPYDVSATSTHVSFVNEREGAYSARVTNVPERSVLVLAQTYYPGWVALVDGKKQPTFPVNIRQIGTELPKGNHSIQLTYEPESFIKGMWITAIASVVTIFLMAFGRFLPI